MIIITILKIFILLFVVLLLISIILLILPVHFDLQANKEDNIFLLCNLSYPFSIIQFHLNYDKEIKYIVRIFGLDLINSEKFRKKKNKENKKVNSDTKSIVKRFLKLKYKEKIEFVKIIKNELKNIIKEFKIKLNDINIEFGFDNPFLVGVILSISSIFKIYFKNLKIYPNFNKNILKGKAKVKSEFVPIFVLKYIYKYIFLKKYANIRKVFN